MSGTCCTPSGDRAGPTAIETVDAGVTDDHAGMVLLADGEFLMGSDDRLAYPADGEGPVRTIRLSPFWIDACAITNDQFGRFVRGDGKLGEEIPLAQKLRLPVKRNFRLIKRQNSGHADGQRH